MSPGPILAVCGGVAAFGAAGLTFALFGLGLPFIVAAAVAGLCAGLVVYACARLLASRRPAAPETEDRARHIAHLSADLRHELRGVLSPALMVCDRLLTHEDPAIQRAGQAVQRSVERATDLIARNKRDLRGALDGDQSSR